MKKVRQHGGHEPLVVIDAEVTRQIRQHGRSSMKAEVCGVLIGRTDNGQTTIDATIAAMNAAQAGTHVTFTQDAWQHIYEVKDRDFPDEKIVGWYHTHPGFGVFLSEHDEFIQKHFFSAEQQVAWVYDPHTDEEGCFGWTSGRIERLKSVRVADRGIAPKSAAEAAGDFAPASDEQEAISEVERWNSAAARPRESVWATRIFTAISYIAIFLLGFLVCLLVVPREAYYVIPRSRIEGTPQPQPGGNPPPPQGAPNGR